MRIAVAGTGYVGLSLAVLLARGSEVVAVDVVPAKVEALARWESPIRDDEIEEALAKAASGERPLSLSATLDAAEGYEGVDFAVVATPTDYDPARNFFDTSSVEAAVAAIRAASPEAWIVVKSTVPVGYTAQLRERLDDTSHPLQPRVPARGPRALRQPAPLAHHRGAPTSPTRSPWRQPGASPGSSRRAPRMTSPCSSWAPPRPRP